ncbi:MAG: flagellar biosynthetic protein FliR, partial [Pseudomonadota bacterium]
MAPGLEELASFYAALARIFSFGDAEVYALAGVFARVGAALSLTPGFGEMTIPVRVKLGAAVAFTALAWPAVAPIAAAYPAPETPFDIGFLIGMEAICGLALGLAVRMFVFALQYAGSIAAQATSVAQILGGGVTPDPMPALGALLTLAGIALALAAGLAEKLVVALIASYAVLPYGQPPVVGDFAAWGVERGADALGLAFGLAAPFCAGALLYNLALGAINRAMPQLMVAFIGAPAITAGALLLLLLAGPAALTHWHGRLDAALAA